MSVRELVGRARYRAGDVYHAMQDWWLYWRVRRSGGSYTDFYEAKMNRKAAKNGITVNGRPSDKQFQLAFLQRHGLRPDVDFLDYGCGAGAAAVNFVGYLEEGRYTGADISEACVDLARAQLSGAGLAGKRPVFVHLPGGSLAGLKSRTFDVIWAQSVFTHMPPDAIGALFDQLPALMKPGARFYATFAHSDNPSPRRNRVKNYDYSPAFLRRLADARGFTCTFVDDWVHPASPNDRMLRLSRRESGR